jgi:FkbH-like protein
MRETIALENPIYRGALPTDVQAGFKDTDARIAKRSMIIWGEHCSECAAPACYSACSFYSPRADGHCRRFVNGIEIIADEPRHVSRISFRRWGKLEGRGPAKSFASAEARFREDCAGPAEAFANLPFLVRRTAWQQTLADRAASQGSAQGYDAFVVEGYAPKGLELAFTLTIVPADKSIAAIFQTKFTLKNTWSRHVVAFADIAKQIDLSKDHLIQIEPVGEAEGGEAIFGHLDFVIWQEGQAPVAPQPITPAKFAKVVVWDLDHTVWDGILLEDGAAGVTLRPGVLTVMEALDQRGILQSVASKNNPDEALAALQYHQIDHFMLAPQIGWGPKSASLSRLAQVLNLGIDSFVFIDDQPFERGEVGEAHASVTVLDEHAITTLLARPQFEVPVTPESKSRRALYAVEAQRSLAADNAGSDYDAFLRSCNLKLTLKRLDAGDAERVYELSQRTNQLNVAATRYSRDDVGALINSADVEGWTMRCTDRFGDYGLIGFALFDPNTGNMADFFMSCRVQRKRVEAAFFAWMAIRMAASSAANITARWRKAARNGPAVEMFEALGFSLIKETENSGRLVRPVCGDFAGGDIVEIIVETAMPEVAEVVTSSALMKAS